MKSKNHTGADYQLRIVEGLQEGAVQSLPRAKTQLMGTSIDCDIVLYPAIDSDLELELQIIAGNTGVVCQLLTGSASCNGEQMSSGERYVLEPDTPVRCGDTVFVVEAPLSQQEDVQLNQDTNEPIEETCVLASEARVENTVPVPAHRKRKLVLSMLMSTVIVAAGASVITGHAQMKSSASEKVVMIPLDDFLYRSGYADLDLKKLSNTEFRLTGLLDGQEQTQLKLLLQERPETIKMKFVSGEDIRESVEALYRSSGVSAEVDVLEPGKVKIRTATSDLGLLSKLEMLARNQNSFLYSIERENSAPDDLAGKKRHRQVQVEEGKRVVAIVAGETGYVETEDGSRYFVEAILPTGHKVMKISHNQVLLNRDGETAELKF